MGTWGPGNFENDSAGDYLDTVLDDFAYTLKSCMTQQKMGSHHFFIAVYGESKVMPTIELLLTLQEQFGGGSYVMSPEDVRDWKKSYLRAFDGVIHDYAKQSFAIERRKVIVETFDKLIAVVDEWNSD